MLAANPQVPNPGLIQLGQILQFPAMPAGPSTLKRKVRRLALRLIKDQEIDNTNAFEFGQGMKKGGHTHGHVLGGFLGNRHKTKHAKRVDHPPLRKWRAYYFGLRCRTRLELPTDFP